MEQESVGVQKEDEKYGDRFSLRGLKNDVNVPTGKWQQHQRRVVGRCK